MIQEVYSLSLKLGDDVRAAAGVGIGTAGAGMATLLEVVSTGLGIIATTGGVVLTVVLIRNHIKIGKLDRRYKRLRIKMVEKSMKDAGLDYDETGEQD